MEDANWVDFAQVGLPAIGVLLWFFPKKSSGGPPLKLPLWNPTRWDGILFLALGTGVVWLGLPGGFLLPCLIFLMLREIDRSKYDAPLSSRTLSYSEITKTSLYSFVIHWPLLLTAFWIWSYFVPDAEAQKSVQDLQEGDWNLRMQTAFFAIVVAPFAEELFFRGILYRTLKSLIDAGPAILVTSLAFAFAHLNLLAFGPLFALSVFLILVYEKSGHLAVPMVYHACFNLLMVVHIIFGHSEI